MKLGDNLITNGDFSSGETGWTFTGNIDHQVTGGELEVYRNGAAPATFYQDFSRTVLPGCTFQVVFGTLRNDSGVEQQFTFHLWNPSASLANLSATVVLAASEDASGSTYYVSDTTPGTWSTTTRFEVFIETATDNQPALYFDDITVKTVYRSSVVDLSNIVLWVDWDDDGYDDADAITEVMNANVILGMQGSGMRVAGVGQAMITLDNDGSEYSPASTTSSHAMDDWIARPCKLDAVEDDVVTRLFTGKTVGWFPTANKYGERLTTLFCLDQMDEWQRAEDFPLPLRADQTADDLLKLVGAGVFRTVAASGTITIAAGNALDDDTLTIGDDTYRFKDTMALAYDVQIGAANTDTAENLAKAINGDVTGLGTSFYAGTLYNQDVTGSASSNVVTVTARARGTYGNSIAMSTSAPHKDADRYTLNTGTLSSGALSDTYTQNSTYMQFSEVTGTPGFDIEFEHDITGTGETLNLYGRYQGSIGHTVNVDAYNGATWDNLGTLVHDTVDAAHQWTLSASHTVSGTVQIRFYHTSPGIASHDLYLDHLYVLADQDQAVLNITLSGATLSGGTDGPSVSLNYDAGIGSFDYAADTWGSDAVNGITVLEDITNSERGWFAINREGEPVFKNRQYEFLAQALTPLTIDNTQASFINPRMSRDDIWNRVIVTTTPRRGVTSGTIATAVTTILVPGTTGAERWNGTDPAGPAGTVTIWLPFKDPASGRSIGATRVNPIIAGTHYTVNENADGSGPDYTTDGSLTLSWIVSANSIGITFTNTAFGPLHVIDLFVEGVGLVPFDDQQIIKEDTTSISTYGVSAAPPITLPLPMSDVFPEDLACYLVDTRKDERFFIDGIQFNEPSNAAATHLIRRELFDVLSITEDQTGMRTEFYMITGIVYDLIQSSTSAVTFILEWVSNFDYWILGASGSQLGTNTRLGL